MILAVLDRHLCCHLAILISLSPSPTPTPTPTRIPQPTPTRVRFRFCSTARRKGRWVLSRVLLAIPMHPWTIPMMIFMLVLVLLASSSLGTCAFRPRPSPRSAPHTGCSHGFLPVSCLFFCFSGLFVSLIAMSFLHFFVCDLGRCTKAGARASRSLLFFARKRPAPS